MAEDWRVTITLDGDSRGVLQALHERESSDSALSRVAVSSDGPTVFLYADTRGAAEASKTALADVLADQGLSGEPRLERWHHEEERWEDPDLTLTPTEEHERLEAEETDESIDEHLAEWEVRIELRSHHDAEAFAAKLEAEGRSVTRRWKYLLVGANDHDDADAFAKQIEAEAPEGTTVHVEPGSGLAWEFMPSNRFAIFGGLGG
jgi:hypothetical protein